MSKSLRCAILFFVILIPLVAASTAQADLKATHVVSAWDINVTKFQNSNVVIRFDGAWEPFLHELDFDTDLGTGACAGGGSTQWAGTMYYGLYHQDNAPAGGVGFKSTRNWELANCDRDGDGDFDNRDLAWQPATYRQTISQCSLDGTYCRLISQDVEKSCTTGNCDLEIETTFYINLDLNCDGTIDLPVPPAGLCFYAEAESPGPLDLPEWQGPLQGRISTVGGEKTVTFSGQPTAVELMSFTATAQDQAILLEWQTATEIDTLGFNLYRAESWTGPQTQINDMLVPSKMPGSPIGASYDWTDTTVVPGVTYYYWLEDVDIYGAATRHGPVIARIGPYRMFLPFVRR